MRSNLKILFIIQAIRWFMLFIPIIILFFQENGLNMTEILTIQAVFSISVILLEIPSGYFADILGRKQSMLIGVILGFFGLLMYSFSQGFWGFLFSELILGLGVSFISGSDSALIYDTLIELKKENNYKEIEGKYSAIGNLSEGVASIIGGFLALISLRTPIYVETIIIFFAIPLTMLIVEPKRNKLDISKGNFKAILGIVKYALHDHKKIKWLIIYSSIIGASTLTMVWFIQPYFQLVGLPTVMFGIVWAALNFSVAYFSYKAHKFENLLGRKNSLISLVILSAIGYFSLSYFNQIWGIFFIVIFYFVRGIRGPIVKDYVNILIPSEIRATVLSVNSLVLRLIFSAIGPFAGYVADIYSLQTALFLNGIIFLTLGVISLFFLKKHKVI